ncbi:cysteinyl-tRNA synthetase, partial [Mortierella sp. NVP85]
MTQYVVDGGELLGMSSIKDDPVNGSRPSRYAVNGDGWHAPESWETISSGPPQKPQVVTPEEVTSDDLEQSDFESWDFEKKKLATLRIFRADTTYTTVNCGYSISASELCAMLARKIFKPDTSKYHLYISRNNIDLDKLDDLSGKDNSFLCRFIFAENGEPLITEADFPPRIICQNVTLIKRCLTTIPIPLHLRAKDIVRLNISHNLRMNLPLDFVQNCTSLRELRMAYNDFDKIPSNVRYIANLQLLDVRGNRLRDLESAFLHEARKLETLILQCNRLDSIPITFHTFQHLRVINLSSNSFDKFPTTLCRIVTLEEIDLSFNEISEIPAEISHLKDLKKLLVYGNKIGIGIPKTMEKLTSLRKLDIRQNGVVNMEPLNNLPALEELLVDYNTNVVLNNTFSALVRASFVKCNMTGIGIEGTGSTLSFLDLSFNKLSNLASGLFEHLKSLETLKLDNNRISSIPGTIGALKKLRTLSIANNNLSTLPDEISQLEKLFELDVHSNSLNVLPASIWNCSLIHLNASSNILESFPDPPDDTHGEHNVIATMTSSSTLTLCDPEPPSKSLPATTAPPTMSHNPPSNGRPGNTTPLSISLETLCLGDNRLPDDVFYPLSHFTALRVLNLSHNFIADIPRGQIPNPGHLNELYLSGNQLTQLPVDDIDHSLRGLGVLYVSGNKLTRIPIELAKITHLRVLDVGCNMLNYNVSNYPYDWNWNWNLELKYLNMSGNKRLRIQRETVENDLKEPISGKLHEFGSLPGLRILGLMDITMMDMPDDTAERRVRTSSSTLHNMSYGMSDTLGDGDNLCIWDLVQPNFQTKDDEVLFGLFDGRSGRSRAGCRMASYLKDRFGPCLKIELEKLEGSDTVVSALRRTFLGLARELWPLAKNEDPTKNEDGKGGVSALVAYIKGTTLYTANVGDTIAVLVKKSDTFDVISHKHIPWNPTEAARIKRSGGFVSENGRLNDELDVSRSFGHYHLVPIVNSNPFIDTKTLSEDDDFLIMASKSFWDVMSYNTAVDIARAGMRIYGDLMHASQKLRDIAISYGAREHMVVMLIGVGDPFKKKELDGAADYVQHKKRPKATQGPTDGFKYFKPEIEPPQGDVAMVFTDIKNSTKLWECASEAMAVAVKEHFDVMRRQLRYIGGYEVKNEGDAMMASFSSVPSAMLWCLRVQELLLGIDWPKEILDSDEGKEICCPENAKLTLYKGLSVRMGIHWGKPVSHKDEVTRRMDYYGPMVNRAARICNAADGGEICVSSDVIREVEKFESLRDSDTPDAEHIREIEKMGFRKESMGEKKLKGLEAAETLYLLYPRRLGRRYSLTSASTAGANGTELVVLDCTSVRDLQAISLRLERLVSGAVATHGRASEKTLDLLSLHIEDSADQRDLVRIADNCIARIENCYSQLFMSKSGPFMEVYESLLKVLESDSNYIEGALEAYLKS